MLYFFVVWKPWCMRFILICCMHISFFVLYLCAVWNCYCLCCLCVLYILFQLYLYNRKIKYDVLYWRVVFFCMRNFCAIFFHVWKFVLYSPRVEICVIVSVCGKYCYIFRVWNSGLHFFASWNRCYIFLRVEFYIMFSAGDILFHIFSRWNFVLYFSACRTIFVIFCYLLLILNRPPWPHSMFNSGWWNSNLEQRL